MSEEPQDYNQEEISPEEFAAAPMDKLSDQDLPRISIAAESRPYTRDDLFKELLAAYQNADWDQSLVILRELIRLYPEEPSLLEFRDDIRMRAMLYQKGSQSQKAETRLRIGQLGIWLLVSVAVFAAIFFLGKWAFSQYSSSQESSRLIAEATAEAQVLITKFNNAEDYLAVDRPDQALTLLLEIDQASPGYPGVAELISMAQDRIALEESYQEGLALFEEEDYVAALAVLQDVQDQDSNYRDVAQLLSQILMEQSISQMTEEIQSAYEQQEWQTVIDTYEQILEIHPGFSAADLEEELFIGYMNLIISIADQPDATMDDIAQAEDYYRAALSLFPQNREFADEREELERVATTLIINKLYIYAISLLETENYSIEALEESIRILNRANNIGSGSPAITSQRALAQSFLISYNAFTQHNYDDAILGFENILRVESDYGGGILRYLLYEAHLARGDIFTAYGEYASAKEDYESAETYAWGENGTPLQLFYVEIKIGYILRRLALYEESAEYFHYAAGLIELEQYLDPEQTDVIEAFTQAQTAYLRGQAWEASRLYDYVYQEANYIFPQTAIRVERGASLLHLSFHFGSTLDFIRQANSLGDAIEARNAQELLIPNLAQND